MSSEAASRSARVEPAIMALTTLVVLLADQLSKAADAALIRVGERVRIVGDLVQLWHVQNRGAAFSLFQGGTLLFVVVSVLAFGLIGYLYRSFRGGPMWLYAVLGVALGGVLGNLIDRLRLGYVTDFVSVGIGDLRWPTFNVADASIVLGIGVIVIRLFLTDADRPAAGA
ncbi:MAG TPA: signal peptidase II [Candidatus Saccharimonadales bacterium]|nr:signal peptidase II [Candidatus Saccharimonadales bacterium]